MDDRGRCDFWSSRVWGDVEQRVLEATGCAGSSSLPAARRLDAGLHEPGAKRGMQATLVIRR